MYNTRDYVNLYNAYRLNGQNVSRAREAFIKRFPDRPRPSRSTIQRLVTRFNTSGNVGRRKKKGRRRTQLTEDNTINIVANVIVEDQLSIRTRALHSGLTKSSLHRILKETNMKAFKTAHYQKLYPGDNERRLVFCNWVQEQRRNDPNFSKRINFTDESTFIRHGQPSKTWSYTWAQENPRRMRETRDQVVEKLKVWCGIWDDEILGPYFIVRFAAVTEILSQ